jgi:hypothetical protein
MRGLMILPLWGKGRCYHLGLHPSTTRFAGGPPPPMGEELGS